MQYVIYKKSNRTIASYPEKKLAENFVKEYKNTFKNMSYKIQGKINLLYETYGLHYGDYEHERIFQHLVDTDYIEVDDIEKYEKLVEELEEHKESEVSLTIEEEY